MSDTWVIAADRARARILSPKDEERKPLSEMPDRPWGVRAIPEIDSRYSSIAVQQHLRV